MNTKVEKIGMDLTVSGQSISVEFSVEELATVGQTSLAMKNAATDAFVKCVPVLKDAITEIGQIFSSELMNHRKLEHSFRLERIEAERIQEKEKQQNYRERNIHKV